MSNQLLIDQFNLLINQLKYEFSKDVLTKSDKNKLSFKIRHYKKIIGILKNYSEKINKGEDLEGIKGIGKGTLLRINEILKNKKLKEVNVKNIKKINIKNRTIKELSEVINIGPTIAKKLVNEYDLKSVSDLKKMIKNNEIKVNDKILMGLKYYGKIKLKIPRTEMNKYKKLLLKLIPLIDKDIILCVAGSYRREKTHSNDIDILITHTKIKTDNEYKKKKINYLNKFINLLKDKNIIIDDLTDSKSKTKYMGFCKLSKNDLIRRIDIRFVPYNSYYSALLYFTGSYELNTQMRQISKNLKYKLNEYGLYKIDKDGSVSKRSIKIKSENDIFKKLKLDYIEPKDR